MPTLHVISQSPADHLDITSCSRLITPDDALMLFSNGAYAALAGTVHSCHVESLLKDGIPVYVLTAAITARGLLSNKLIPGVVAVDYEGFVGLVARYVVTQSW